MTRARWVRLGVIFVALQTVAVSAMPTLKVVDGVLVEPDTGREVPLVGTNYCAPFGEVYRNVSTVPDARAAITDDLLSIHQMGLNAIRVIVDDAELMQADGTLQDNHHLELLDYLLAAAGQLHLYVVLTPISFNHGLQPVHDATGQPASLRARFQSFQRLLTDPAARALQETYLTALFTRQNRYTGQMLAEDPTLALVELLAQPVVPPGVSDEQLTGYIDALVGTLRTAGVGAGTLFWLGGRSTAVGRSQADGVSVSCYPTGLESGRAATGNFSDSLNSDFGLKAVALQGKLKACVEFDAADTELTWLYPAIAQALRAAGAQVALQFQYDSMVGATANNNRPSHFFNLVTTPGKAIAMRIAAEVFRTNERGAPLAPYPLAFHGRQLRIETRPDCARWSSPGLFCHTNGVSDAPPSTTDLRAICGRGSSPFVDSDGLGSYWLQRITNELAVLKLYPDVEVVGNPFELRRWVRLEQVTPLARLDARVHSIALTLEPYGSGWWAWPVRRVNDNYRIGASTPSHNGRVSLAPGVYLLTDTAHPPDLPEGIDLELHLPPERPTPPLLDAVFPATARPHEDLLLTAHAAGDETLRVTLHIADAAGREVLAVPARSWVDQAQGTRDVDTRANLRSTWSAVLPGTHLEDGTVQAWWSATDTHGTTLAPPDGRAVKLGVGRDLPFTMVDFGSAQIDSVRKYRAPDARIEAFVTGGSAPERSALQVLNHRLGGDGYWQLQVPLRLTGLDLGSYDALRLRARATPAPAWIQVDLVEDDGATWSTTFELPAEWASLVMPLRKLQDRRGGRVRQGVRPDHVVAVNVRSGAWLYRETAEAYRFIFLDDLAFERSTQR